MRLNDKPVKLAVAALFAGGLAVTATVGIARAASPAPTKMEAPATGSENDKDYVQHLRSIRRALNDNRKLLLDEPMSDRAGHRKAAVEAMDKAINEVNAEVIAYDKDMKDGKGV